MVDPVSSVGSALQATLTGDLLKTLSAALASGSVTDAPPSVTNTQSPLAISGTLQSQLENGGGAVVQTAAGPVTLSFPTPVQQPLPQGTLTLLIQPGNPPTASIVSNQVVTSQAQIQTQATAAQQTQDVQTQPLQALPPITVGQVLTATPLPPATTASLVQAVPQQDTTPAPVVSQAAAGAAVASAIAAELPIAVMLNSAIPPAPTAPSATFVKGQPFVVEKVEGAPEEEPVSLDGQQAQAQNTYQPQSQNAAVAGPSPQIDTDLDEDMEISAPVNFLAAQESLNETEPLPTAPAPLAYNPAASAPSAAQSNTAQDFLVLKVGTPQAVASGPFVVGNAAQGQMVTATVIAQTSSGQPLLEMEDGSAMLINQKVSSPIGTEITLQRLDPEEAQIQSASQTSSPAQGAGQAPISIAPLSTVPLSIARQLSWPALTQLLTTLDNASPLAASFIRQAIPSTGDGFAQAFTAFLARGAPAASYPAAPGTLVVPLTLLPGQAAAAHTADPQQLRAALLQIGSDLANSAAKTAPAAPALAQSWQAFTVPVLTDYGISMAQLFMRQQIDPVDDQAASRATGSSTRFLIEISPSQLGPVQLDGLLRQSQANARTKIDRLDLIIRTEFAVPSSAANEMASLFQSALGATGMAGNLGFQVGPENFVLPSSDSNQPYRGGV